MKIKRVLFLDIDGVLNNHNYDKIARSCVIKPIYVARLNEVISRTDCSIVVSSAWRYMVLSMEMTLKGFEYLLRTHGVHCANRVVGHLAPDRNQDDPNDRAKLVYQWLLDHEVDSAVVVDDLDLQCSIPFVRTDGAVGLTDQNVEEIVAAFGI